MTVKNIMSQLEKTFGRQSETYLIQLLNDGLIDIANKKQGYTVSALTDLEKNKRWYDLPSSVISIERIEILDSNNRYIMIPKLTDPHKLLRADTDNTQESTVLK
jgi:hypothetical protein